jgi:serine/threonine protein kinase, bacterial
VEERTVFQPLAFGSVKSGVRLNGIYEIERLIAQGGMGEVYRGFNIQTRDPVAIKMIRPEFSNDPEILELFRREASILHGLAHEAIVRYFVFSIDPELRRAYLATEFVDGESLTNKLSFGPLPLADVRTLQKRVALALDAAHRHGVIHRDISPDNIILPDDDVRNAKVIDFGIARSVQRTEVSIIGGRFAGKYNYASPEQFGLAGGEVTFKSDIYSFGLVLAAALRGRPIDMSGSEVEAIAKRRVLPDLSDIDPTIRPLLQQMLEPLPADRPESMAAVAEWEPRQAARAPSRARSGERGGAPASGRMAAALGAVIALASVGGAAFVFRNDFAQWGRSVVALAPSGAVKPPPAGETPAEARTKSFLPPLKPLEPTPVPLPPAQEPTSTALVPPPSAPAPESNLQSPPPKRTAPAPTPAPKAQSSPPQVILAAPAPKEELSPQAAPISPSPQDRDGKKLADALADSLPPKAPQSPVELPSATVGARYRAELPVFDDPGGKGLRLTASGLPEGVTFSDLGQGRGKIEGAPERAGRVSMQIFATNHNGKTAQSSATMVIADRAQPKAMEPSPAPQAGPMAPPVQSAPAIPKMETAPASDASPPEKGPIAGLAPPPSPAPPSVEKSAPSAPDTETALGPHAGPAENGPLARLAPAPPPAEKSAPSAPNAETAPAPQVGPAENGQFARLEPTPRPAAPPVEKSAAPAQPSTPEDQKAQPSPLRPSESPSSIEKGRAFAAAFDGGDCFLIRPRARTDGPHAYLALGREPGPFQRFDSAYKSAVGVEADVRAGLIPEKECEALDLIRLSADGASPPRIELAQYDIGRGKPLAGTITNLGGRRLYLVLVDNDGVIHRLDFRPEQGGDGATFSVQAAPRPDSIGPMQILLAVATDRPISALETLRSAPLKSIAAHLVDEARQSSASVEADYFKFVN